MAQPADATLTDEDAKALREPFDPAKVGKLPRVTCKDCSDKNRSCSKHQKKRCDGCRNYISEAHIHLDYVGHAATTDRLLQVDPHWTWEPFGHDDRGLPALDHEGNLWIRLTIKGLTRPGVGDGPNMKERIGDALRNAAMRFGVALDLWAKEDLTEGRHDDHTPERDEAQDQADAATRSELMELFNALHSDMRDKVLDRLRKANIIKRKTNGAIGTVDSEHFDTVRRTLEAAAAAAAGGPAMEPAAEEPPPPDEFPSAPEPEPEPMPIETPPRESHLKGIEHYRSQLSDADRILWLGWMDEHHKGKSIEKLTDEQIAEAFEAIGAIAAGEQPA